MRYLFPITQSTQMGGGGGRQSRSMISPDTDGDRLLHKLYGQKGGFLVKF